MNPPKMRFKLDQLRELDGDFARSRTALPVIVQKVFQVGLRKLRRSLLENIPNVTGELRKSFGYSAQRPQPGLMRARFGFFQKRQTSRETIIAGNVLVHGSATPRRGQWLWIPLSGNRKARGGAIVSPRDLIAGGGHVRQSLAGNMVAFQRGSLTPDFVLKKRVSVGRPIDLNAAVENALPPMLEEIPQVVTQIIAARQRALAA